MSKSAFTLVETLIVLVIIGILAGCIIQSYVTVSAIAFRIDQTKNLTEESLMLTQIMEAIAGEATIDYARYEQSLIKSNGYTDKLYLTGGNRSGVSIYSTGLSCLPLEGGKEGENGIRTYDMYAHSDCNIVLEQNGKITPLVATNNDEYKKIIVSDARFRVIPYETLYYLYDKGIVGEIVNQLARPAVWLFVHFYSPYYEPVGKNQIDQPLQLFFNLNEPIEPIFF